MEMSNDKTITETLPVIYGKWTIKEDNGGLRHIGRPIIAFPTEEGIQHEMDCGPEGFKYCGNCLWSDSIEEAKELIDEKQN